MRLFIAGALALALAGCGQDATEPADAAQEPAPAPPEPEAEAPQPVPPPQPEVWMGQWNGPEGTYLKVEEAEAPGQYRLTLLDNLDGPPKTYDAQGTGETLTFTRDGTTIAMRRGPGAETGFKWLADKMDCIILVPNQEGYCRD